jgi:hypothetical protein
LTAPARRRPRPPPRRPPPSRSSPRHAERWRRYRARRRAGLAVAPVEIDAAIVALLIETHWLDERDAGNCVMPKQAIPRACAVKPLPERALATLCFSAHCQTGNRARSSILAAGPNSLPPGRALLHRHLPPRPPPQGFIIPCLATRADRVPTGPQWAHEIKHDGYRFIVRRDGDRVRIFSRRGLDWTDRVPSIVASVRALRVRSAVIDGEAVVARDDGVTDFDALSSALASRDGCEPLRL